MVAAVETAVAVEDVVTSVIMVGLVATVEVVLADEVEEVVTGQISLMVLMYWTRLKTLQMKNGGSLHIMVDGCVCGSGLRMNERSGTWRLQWTWWSK
jgi:hypothetical protein